MQAFVYTTLRLVRISLLINAITKSFAFFSGKLFHKSNRKLFSCVCIVWYKHSRGWENSRQLCKPSTLSRVCITVSNSPNPSSVYIRLSKHGKRFLLLNWHTVKGLKQQYPSDVAPLTVTHKFLAAPKPPGKTRASWCVVSSSAREEIFPRAIRADSAKTFLTGN